MKKLVLILSALSLIVCLAVPSTAQTPTRVLVEVDVPPPAKTYAPAAVRPVYADAPPPPPVVLPRAGSGCYGSHQAGGCFGKVGGSCYGTPPRTIAQITYEVELRQKAAPELLYALGGCQGRAGGCYGTAAYTPGFVTPMPVAYGAPRPFAYAVDGTPIPRGAPRGDGKYATESGKPLPPGVVPWDGPFIGELRDMAGYNRRR